MSPLYRGLCSLSKISWWRGGFPHQSILLQRHQHNPGRGWRFTELLNFMDFQKDLKSDTFGLHEGTFYTKVCTFRQSLLHNSADPLTQVDNECIWTMNAFGSHCLQEKGVNPNILCASFRNTGTFSKHSCFTPSTCSKLPRANSSIPHVQNQLIFSIFPICFYYYHKI